MGLTLASAAFAQNPATNTPLAPNPYPTPPAPSAPRIVSVPTPVESKLANGLRVIAVPRPGSGLVSVQLLLPYGEATQPGDKNGTAVTVAELLTKGTTTRTATQIAGQVEQLGASLGASAGYDSTVVSLGVLKSRLNEAMPLLADVLQNPTFPAEELTRYRTQTTDDLTVAYRAPGTLARLVAARVLYGDSRYGNPATGTPDSLKVITRDDLMGAYRSQYQIGYAVLVISGDITPEAARVLAQTYFGAWRNPKAGYITGNGLTALPPPEKRHIVVIDRPDAGQAAVQITRFGVKQSELNLEIAQLTNDILGGGYSSRLNREVRVKRGLSYGANSSLAARAETGPLSLYAQTKNESAGETAQVLVEELGKLGTSAPTPDEFAARKSALSGDFARALETGGGIAGLVGQLALYHRPLSELQTYLSRVQAVTPDQVRTFADQRFGAATASVVIVGNAAKFLPDLKTRFPSDAVTVIPFAALDLNSATLVKDGK